MRRATVVIGSNYGDEGKGIFTDYLASKFGSKAVVARFNGGAQAGHTVVMPDGKRHVFAHFGSGTLAGAATYLAKHFVLNPILFWQEAKELSDLGATLTPVAADPRCFVTTPYDMIINQILENSRGATRHGSVGVGFGETIERNNYPAFRLLKEDLKDHDRARTRIKLIRDQWLPHRLRQLRLPSIPKSDDRLSDHHLEQTVNATLGFDEIVKTHGAEFLDGRDIVFEGAQGLCLDMDGPNFPHVTRSNTGLTNVIPIARVLGLSLDVVYATRPYLTKHGAGPLPREYVPDPAIVDETNIDHPYQGTIRFGRMGWGEFSERIRHDFSQTEALGFICTQSVALSCLDQVGESRLVDHAKAIGKLRFYSLGPQRDRVAEIMK